MSDILPQTYTLLHDVIMPDIKGMMASQAEQRLQTERLQQELAEFCNEMHLYFAELRAELATLRAQVEDAMVTLAESESSTEADCSRPVRKSTIH